LHLAYIPVWEVTTCPVTCVVKDEDDLSRVLIALHSCGIFSAFDEFLNGSSARRGRLISKIE
jgi:hypothetical protein